MIPRFTFALANAILGDETMKQVQVNTRLHRLNPWQIGVRWGSTDIAIHHRDGNCLLNTNGWRIVGARERLNKFTPAKISAKNGIWAIDDAFFQDGMIVNKSGKIQGRSISLAKAIKQKHYLDKAISAYIKAYVGHCLKLGKLPALTDSICMCCIYRDDGNIRDLDISEPLGVYHLIDHIRAEEYPAQLLWKAVRLVYKNYASYHDGYFAHYWNYLQNALQANGDVDSLESYLTSYFRSRKQAMLEMLLELGNKYHE